MVSFTTVCHYLNLATPEYDDANSEACDDGDDTLSELLAAMSPCSSEEEKVTTKESSDDEIYESDEECYKEHGYNLYSVVLPMVTEDLLLFPVIMLVCLMNYPVFVKDVANAICIVEFGWRLFALMNSAIKKCLCMAISQSSVVIQPHPSQYVFCKGKCTVSLQTLVSGLQAAGIQHVTLVAYGMKMNYSECLFFDEFNDLALQRRYDIGRNISTKSIPVFGLFDVQGTVYPVFDNLGAGYGSVEIPLDSPNNRLYSITLKCYPRLLHQLKSHKLTINPTNPISLNPNNPEFVPSPGLETAKMRGETSVEPWWTRTQGWTEEEAPLDHERSPSEVPRHRPGRLRKSPVLETSGFATDSDDEDVGTESGVLKIRCENHSISDELQNEFPSVLRTVSSCEEGDFSGRARPSCKKIVVPKKLVKAVDELIAEEFLKGSLSHWSLNCLVYASAELVSRWVRRTYAEKPRNQSGQKRKEAQVQQLRRKIGWLEADIHRRKSGKRATPRQWNNSRRLRMKHCFLCELEASLRVYYPETDIWLC